MLDKIIPKKIIYLSRLIRLDKPIGFLLLMWPCWFALASLQTNNFDIIIWYIIFFLGSFFMRSAGCIINDIVDRNIDLQVKRTKSRPIASNKINLIEAFIILFIFLLLSLLILLQFNYMSILVGLLSMPLIILYPFMKRITYWPQIFLGIIFSWGILIIAVEFNHQSTINLVILFVISLLPSDYKLFRHLVYIKS